MGIMKDDVMGQMSYEYGWVRNYSIPFFGESVDVQLVVPCDEGDEIEEAQRAAFLHFDANKSLYMQQTQEAIFNHYLEVCEEYRERLGGQFADKMAPIVTEEIQLKPLIKPTQVIIQQSFSSNQRVVGVLFDCSWEPELGLAVKFVNSDLDEVGPQDIVL